MKMDRAGLLALDNPVAQRRGSLDGGAPRAAKTGRPARRSGLYFTAGAASRIIKFHTTNPLYQKTITRMSCSFLQ